MTQEQEPKSTFQSQAEVNLWFQTVKGSWEAKLKESGQKEAVFIASNKEASSVLYHFSLVKQTILEDGFSCPELSKGVKLIDHGDSPAG